MTRVLHFNNFLKNGESTPFSKASRHEVDCVGPGGLRANPYPKHKHMGLMDLVRRVLACRRLARQSRGYQVLIVDGSVTAILVSFFLWMRRSPRVIISNFNVLRRRGALVNRAAGTLLSRVDRIVVHSRHDIDFASGLYRLPHERFVFQPYAREAPADGPPTLSRTAAGSEPYVMSFGSNARDYRTLFEAVRGLPHPVLVVAREYNLEGLDVPDNVEVLFNIPLEECDRLVSRSRLTVFTFDGSEPSCGQISLVTSFMFGVPVICTPSPGMEGYLQDGRNGLLAAQGDPGAVRSAIEKAMTDDALYAHLAEGARRWVAEHVSPDSIHGAMDGVIDEIAA